MNAFFLFFFLSGFCSLVYQVVWLRVAMADFGVTTPLVSMVLSVFMAGLALGSWGGGRVVRRLGYRPAGFFVRLYGATELTIGVSGVAVAPLLALGHRFLGGAWGSAGHYLAAGCWITLVMLPFSTAMGATFPFAMAGIRRAFEGASARSFSFLYLANVLGAMTGTLGSAFVMIEIMGFRRTVLTAAGVNTVVAAGAFFVAGRVKGEAAEHTAQKAPAARPPALLLVSGISSLGMEVVWTRQFVPFLGPVVYAFAAMLAVYLAATAVGSRVYRRWKGAASAGTVAVLAGCCALLPLAAADPRIDTGENLVMGAMRVLAGVGCFCGVLGFLTPMLVDGWSAGDPDRAGRAYAVNAIGCIIGPLIAGFVLLPLIGERWTLVLLAVPFFAFGIARTPRTVLAAAVAVSLATIVLTRDFETLYPDAVVRRDHTATVIATGEGLDKDLLINGVGITSLTPITKMMAHFPLASLDTPPRKVLVVCFGMGTSFRAALSWGAEVTSVDLVPSVPPLMGFFHADGAELLRSPRAHVVIDDGRRFLERTGEVFDAIVIDPPPPVAAAGSSLLYSVEFYRAAACRAKPAGSAPSSR